MHPSDDEQRPGLRGALASHFADAWRMEFPLCESLQLTFKHYEYFVYSQCLPAWLLLALRTVLGALSVSVFLHVAIVTPTMGATIRSPQPPLPPAVANASSTSASSTTSGHRSGGKRHFFLCYLTMWSYLVIVIYFATALANTLAFLLGQRRHRMPEFRLTGGGFKTSWAAVEASEAAPPRLAGFSLRLQWLLFGLAANLSLLVTIAYFSFVYPGGARRRLNRKTPISWTNLMVHAFNVVFMLVEVACGGVPVRLGHLAFTLVYMAVYVLFSLLYWLMNNSNIMYKVLLDWNNFGLTVGAMAATVLVAMPAIQLAWWLVFVARGLVGSAIDARQAGEAAVLMDAGGH